MTKEARERYHEGYTDGRNDGANDELVRVVRWMREYARKDIATENKLAANGAYKSASEAANWRMGLQAAAAEIEVYAHRKAAGS